MKSVLVLLVVVALSLPALADGTLTIGGRPFTGRVVTSGGKTYADVEVFARALGLFHQRDMGGWYLYHGREDQSKLNLISRAGQVVVGDRLVDTLPTDDGTTLLDVGEAAAALGLTVQSGPAGLALTVPASWSVPSASGAVRPVAGGIPPLYLTQDDRGTVLDVPGAIMPGRYTIFWVYTTDNEKHKAALPQLRQFMDQHKNDPLIRLVMVNIGFFGSATQRRYGFDSLPILIIVARDARTWLDASHGHYAIMGLMKPNLTEALRRMEEAGQYVIGGGFH